MWGFYCLLKNVNFKYNSMSVTIDNSKEIIPESLDKKIKNNTDMNYFEVYVKNLNPNGGKVKSIKKKK